MSPQLCLKWNNRINMMNELKNLFSVECMVDVTLACDGLNLKAHKIVLSACSPFFRSLFVDNPCKHPIVIMKDIKYADLKAIIDFIYCGEVDVDADQLPSLLETAKTLKVKGLGEVESQHNENLTVKRLGEVESQHNENQTDNISLNRSDSAVNVSNCTLRHERSACGQSDNIVYEPEIKQEILFDDLDETASNGLLNSCDTNDFELEREQLDESNCDKIIPSEENIQCSTTSMLQILTMDKVPNQSFQSTTQLDVEQNEFQNNSPNSNRAVPTQVSDTSTGDLQQPEILCGSIPLLQPKVLIKKITPPQSPMTPKNPGESCYRANTSVIVSEEIQLDNDNSDIDDEVGSSVILSSVDRSIPLLQPKVLIKKITPPQSPMTPKNPGESCYRANTSVIVSEEIQLDNDNSDIDDKVGSSVILSSVDKSHHKRLQKETEQEEVPIKKSLRPRCNSQKNDAAKNNDSNSEKVLKKSENPGSSNSAENIYRCKNCSFQTIYTFCLKRHNIVMHGEKPFKCNQCKYKAAQKFDLVHHKAAVHQKERPFHCTFCIYRSAYRSDLNRHIKCVHKNIKGKFKCDKCYFVTLHKSTLTAHIAGVHQKLRPYHCSLCNFKFPDNRRLNKHIKHVHKKEKKFKCVECNYHASDNWHLKRHSQVHKKMLNLR